MKHINSGIISYKWILIIGALVAIFICNKVYATDFGPFQGRIIDKGTKEPVSGVVVLVEWWKIPLLGGGPILIDAQETLTDKDGNFYMSGIWVFNPTKHYGTDAIMTIFKSGYQAIETGAMRNWKQINPKIEYVLKLEDGKPVIMLKKLTMEERRKRHADKQLLPDNKQRLLIKELNKEYKELGISLYPEVE